MKKLLFGFLTLMLLCGVTYSQWISNYSGPGFGDSPLSDAKGLSVTVDNSGNCYVTGVTSSNGGDIIVIKYTPAGDTAWVRTYNGSGNSDDQGFGIATDNSGNVFITGTSTTNKGYDVVLLKYNSNGDFQWGQTYPGSTGTGEDKGLALSVDNTGFIYVTGYSTDINGIISIITIKYDENGNTVWHINEGGHDNLESKGFGIAEDHAGNVNITGYAKSTDGQNDIIVIQYSPDGNRNWRQVYNGTANADDQAFGIAVDQADNIYVTGYVTDASANNTDCVLIKYASDGTQQWASLYNGLGNGADQAFGIAVDSDGSIYITGWSTSASGDHDYVTMGYSSDGTRNWITTYNGTGNGEDKPSAIGIIHNHDNTTYVVVTGSSMGDNTNMDYATVKYSSTDGGQLQASRYSMTGTSVDDANALAVSPVTGDVFVTGFSTLIVNSRPVSYMTTTMLKMASSVLNTLPNVPNKFSLHQNYPNPFNPTTTIKYDIVKNSNVKLVVYDIMGRVVTTLVNQYMTAGSYNITFAATNLSSGIYFYELTAGDFKDVKKLSVVK